MFHAFIASFLVTLLQLGKENRVQIQNTLYHQDLGVNVSMCHYLMSNYYFNGIYCHNKHHILYIVQCNG
jgi:hypothetical protein